jgi:hypothetical protein
MNELSDATGIMDVTLKLVAGFFGGAVYAFYDKKTHPLVIAGSIGTGTAVATFLGDFAVRVLGSYVGTGGSYFVAGVCGTVIVPGVIGLVRAWMERLKPPGFPKTGDRSNE